MIKKAAVVFALLGLSIAGCGGSDSSVTISYEPWSLPGNGERKERSAEAFLSQPSKNGLIGPELKPVIPDLPPPEFPIAVDLIDSFSPATASPGDQVTVQYVGVEYDSEEKFASSWDEKKPFTFTIGQGEVIKGWEEGFEKAEIADRREMVIPPEFTTGGSRMRGIPKDETLVFVLDVLDIKEK